MSAEPIAFQPAEDGSPRSLPRVSPSSAALGAIALLSALLNMIQLDREGYANTYYAAAVKSMLTSWHNFFFVSFDPAGFVAVDKPPLGLWIQAASAKVFGFSGLSILLPQAIAGVLCVLLLYRLVGRAWGTPAGLLAALFLALTPIAVVDSRNNTSDTVLILMLLLAVWAVLRAAERGELRWLLLSAAFIGLGFNIKELEAYIILPVLPVVYLLGRRRSLLVTIGHLLTAGLTVVIVSFSWILAVDLTPSGARPYVSDSGTNSELSLALGYNGLGRLATGITSHFSSIPFLHEKLDFTIVPAFSADIGNPGLLRLIQPAIGGQASWLLPLALAGLVGAALQLRRDSGPARLSLVAWGVWLLMAGVFFSVARFYHLYYLNLIAPPIAALAAIGLVALWREYRERGGSAWKGWILPAALVATAFVQMRLLGGYPGWNAWLGPVVVGVTLLAGLVLVAGRLNIRMLLAPDLILQFDARAAFASAVVGVSALLAAPAAFAATSVADGNGGAWLPQAGPSTGFGGPGGRFGTGQFTGGPPRFTAGGRFGGFTPPSGGSRSGGPPGGAGFRFRGGFAGGVGGAMTFAGGNVPALDTGLVRYLESHRGTARYLVATPTTSYASLFILQTGQPVMALGGYQGWDRILALAQLKGMVARGEIRFFLLSGSGRFSGGGPPGFSRVPNGVDTNLDNVNSALTTWVTRQCTVVPVSRYRSSSARGTVPGTLYDCAGR